MASMNAMPLNRTARLAVAPEAAMASSSVRPPGPLVAVARDDEERVVGGDREPHHRGHVEDVRREIEPLADQRRQRERDDDREDGDHERHDCRDHRAEHEHEDHERCRDAEVELSRLEVVGEDLIEVTVGAALAGDRHVEGAAVGRRHDLRSAWPALSSQSPLRPIGITVALAVLARRGTRRRSRTCSPRCGRRRSARTSASTSSTLRRNGRLVDGQARGADEDQLVDVLRLRIRRKVPPDQLVAALGFRVGGDLALRGEHRPRRVALIPTATTSASDPRAQSHPRPARARSCDRGPWRGFNAAQLSRRQRCARQAAIGTVS